MTRASLIAQSVVAYDVIGTLSREAGITIDGVGELLVEIGEASAALQADEKKTNLPDEVTVIAAGR